MTDRESQEEREAYGDDPSARRGKGRDTPDDAAGDGAQRDDVPRSASSNQRDSSSLIDDMEGAVRARNAEEPGEVY
jgi:hypothetical protein